MHRNFDSIDIMFIILISTYFVALFIAILWIVLEKLEKKGFALKVPSNLNHKKTNTKIVRKKKENKVPTEIEEKQKLDKKEESIYDTELIPIVIDDRTMSMKLPLNDKVKQTKKISQRKTNSKKGNTTKKTPPKKKSINNKTTKKSSTTKKTNTNRSKGYVTPKMRKTTKNN